MLGFYLPIRRVPFPLTYWKDDHTIAPKRRRNHHEQKQIPQAIPPA
jgi:hypothetical protein